MHNLSIDLLDDVPRPLIAIANDYPDGTLLDWHQHRRAQLLHGATGIMRVETRAGSWVVPPQRAVWIPAEEPHRVLMLGVSTRSLYIEPSASPRPERHCVVLDIAPLLRQLLFAAVDCHAEYDEQGREGALVTLLMHEVQATPVLPLLHIPLPDDDPLLAALCQDFLRQPDIKMTEEQWAQRLHLSPRSFRRHFRARTGWSFQQWRQHACAVMALPRLAAGESVTAVALELGYDSPGAFATMFRRRLGASPSCYMDSPPP